MKTCAAIVGLVLLSVFQSFCEEATNKCEGIINGRVYYGCRDYGPLMGDTNYHRVIGDEFKEAYKTYTLSQPGFIGEVVTFGKCYCYEKRSHPEPTRNEQVADLINLTGAKYRPKKSYSAEQIMLFDAAAAIAEKTLCPNGYPNPIVARPLYPFEQK